MTFAGVSLDDFPRWITAGGVLAILSVIATTYINRLKLNLQEKKEDREGFGALIEALSRDVAAVREQYRQCEMEHARTRQELDGLRRQFITYQMAVAQAVPPERRTPEIEAIMTSLERRKEGEGD